MSLTKLDFTAAASHAASIRSHSAHALAHKILLGLELELLHSNYGIAPGKPKADAPRWADLVHENCGIGERTATKYRLLAEQAAVVWGDLHGLARLLEPQQPTILLTSAEWSQNSSEAEAAAEDQRLNLAVMPPQTPDLVTWLAERTDGMSCGDLKDAWLACLPEEEEPEDGPPTLPAPSPGKQKQDEDALRRELAESWAGACQDLTLRINSDEYRRLPDPALELAADALRGATLKLEEEITNRKTAATKPKPKRNK